MRLNNSSVVHKVSSTLNILLKKDLVDIVIGGEAEMNALFKMFHTDRGKRPFSLNVMRAMLTNAAKYAETFCNNLWQRWF